MARPAGAVLLAEADTVTSIIPSVAEIPWLSWLVTLGMVNFVGLPLLAAYLVLAERKLVARFQDRIGPNRVGPLGLLQPIADGLKLILKEPIGLASSRSRLHAIAPALLIPTPFLIVAIIPFGPGLSSARVPAGILVAFAAANLPTLAIFLASWASGSKYAFLGGLRAVAQLISYEIPLILATLPAILWAGSLDLHEIVRVQAETGWFLLNPAGFYGAAILYVAGLAEVNRAPFDLPEAESELVAGYHTEYTGIRFGLFFLAEYLGMFAISCLVITLYLGGGHSALDQLWNRLGSMTNPAWLGQVAESVGYVSVFLLKSALLLFLMIWIRATIPRLRIDRLMNLAWKVLVPLSLVNLAAATIWYEIALRPGSRPLFPGLGWLITASLLLGATWLLTRWGLGSKTPGTWNRGSLFEATRPIRIDPTAGSQSIDHGRRERLHV